jgi:hypothetical protein
LQERTNRAGLWEAAADERERLADERERLADERDALAHERERLADRHDAALNRREAEDGHLPSSDEELDDSAEAEARSAAVRRAEAAVQRAQAELVRARLATERTTALGDRRAAARDRIAAAAAFAESADLEDRSWLADRRDFVAAERARFADQRDEGADECDHAADRRERLADAREVEALERGRRIGRRSPAGQGGDLPELATEEEYTDSAGRRARGNGRRRRAAAARRVAVEEHLSASAQWGPQPYGPMLVASFADLAPQLFGADDLSGVLTRILKFTVDMVAGCDWASVTLVRRGQVVDTLSSGAVADELDHVQFGSGFGPAFEAMRSTHPVYVADLAEASRWPVLAATAADLGVASALCHGLFVQHPAEWSTLGSLNLYGGRSDAFGETDQDFASILAAYVAVAAAMSDRRDEVDRREAALHRGLSTRDVIGQAKGILMERQRLSAGEAFDVLRGASQRLNRKVVDVARHLADTGELPS